jgi:deoxypyrimidine-specific 5' nucleotidase type C protein (NT5C)
MAEPAKFVLGVDLDGVCADFYGGLRPIAAEWVGKPVEELREDVTYGLPEWGLGPFGGYAELHRFAVTERQFFEKVPPMPGCPPAMRRLSALDIRIRIVTHRLFIKHFHEEAVLQTVAWLDRNGIPYWDLCFMKDKAAVGADLYVEDSPDNIRGLRAAGFHTLVFTNSTNLEVEAPRADSWEEVVDYVIQRRADWLATGGERKSLAGQ